MTISNEPGFYEDNNFGIRIENILITKECQTKHNFGNKKYCQFENATLVPIKTSIINKELLTKEDIDYVNQYHIEVRTKLLSSMNEYFPEAVSYLLKETELI